VSVEHVDVVRGKSIVRLPATQLVEWAAAAARVVVDVGAGDGGLAYRQARAHPDWLCLALDACAAGMQRLSWRAGRKPSRGGAPNAVFVRASVESIPQALAGIGDEVTVCYPWRGLRDAVIEPDLAVLARIVRLGRPGSRLRIRVNDSALPSGGDFGRWLAHAEPRLRRGYAARETSWGARLQGGRHAVVLAIDGTVRAAPATAETFAIDRGNTCG
jgi:hypothetical protein